MGRIVHLIDRAELIAYRWKKSAGFILWQRISKLLECYLHISNDGIRRLLLTIRRHEWSKWIDIRLSPTGIQRKKFVHVINKKQEPWRWSKETREVVRWLPIVEYAQRLYLWIDEWLLSISFRVDSTNTHAGYLLKRGRILDAWWISHVCALKSREDFFLLFFAEQKAKKKGKNGDYEWFRHSCRWVRLCLYIYTYTRRSLMCTRWNSCVWDLLKNEWTRHFDYHYSQRCSSKSRRPFVRERNVHFPRWSIVESRKSDRIADGIDGSDRRSDAFNRISLRHVWSIVNITFSASRQPEIESDRRGLGKDNIPFIALSIWSIRLLDSLQRSTTFLHHLFRGVGSTFGFDSRRITSCWDRHSSRFESLHSTSVMCVGFGEFELSLLGNAGGYQRTTGRRTDQQCRWFRNQRLGQWR